jgi:hypothetical protein
MVPSGGVVTKMRAQIPEHFVENQLSPSKDKPAGLSCETFRTGLHNVWWVRLEAQLYKHKLINPILERGRSDFTSSKSRT